MVNSPVSAPQQQMMANAKPHTKLDDAYAFFSGMVLIAIGMTLLKSAGLVTAGVPGISLILSYLLKMPVGILFTLVNLPFFIFGAITMGRTFILKSIIASTMVSLGLTVAAHGISMGGISVPLAAIAGGTAIGNGILAITRHRSGVGGTMILALWIHRTRNINLGIVALIIDLMILTAAAFVVKPYVLLWSALSAVAIHATLFAWHRPGRYIGY